MKAELDAKCMQSEIFGPILPIVVLPDVSSFLYSNILGLWQQSVCVSRSICDSIFCLSFPSINFWHTLGLVLLQICFRTILLEYFLCNLHNCSTYIDSQYVIFLFAPRHDRLIFITMVKAQEQLNTVSNRGYINRLSNPIYDLMLPSTLYWVLIVFCLKKNY